MIQLLISLIWFSFFIGFIILAAALSYNRRKAHRVVVTEFQNTLLNTQLEIQEQTFKTISQELHDNIGQMLSLAKLNLSKYSINPLSAAPNIAEAENLLSKSINALRDLSKTLNTDTISRLGLLGSIAMELEVVAKASCLQTTLETAGMQMAFSPDKEIIIFRIVQEALHNVIKHADANRIVVTLKYEPKALFIKVSDDGQGLDINKRHAEGSGMRNMQSRALAINAQWGVESYPSQGTTIKLNIPFGK